MKDLHVSCEVRTCRVKKVKSDKIRLIDYLSTLRQLTALLPGYPKLKTFQIKFYDVFTSDYLFNL